MVNAVFGVQTDGALLQHHVDYLQGPNQSINIMFPWWWTQIMFRSVLHIHGRQDPVNPPDPGSQHWVAQRELVNKQD